jgi:hypothetical protein
MQVLKVAGRAKVRKVKSLIKSAGNHFFAVSFIKRSNGKLRRMSGRLHVYKPQYEKEPTGKKFLYKMARDAEKNLLTIFDANVLRYNNKNRLCGRGGFRSIPLNNVVRLKVGGTIYKFV